MKKWVVPVTKYEKERDDKDRAPFSGTREIFNSCTSLIVDYLKATIRDHVLISSETSASACLQYLHGHGGATMKLENGKRKTIDPSNTTPRLNENAYCFLREWIDDDSDGYDSDGVEPYLSRYLRAVPFFVSWVESFPCIRIPISITHMLVLRPHCRLSLIIDPLADFEHTSRDVLMTICKRDSQMDVTENIWGKDICIRFLTLKQFREYNAHSIIIPEGTSHVLTILFGYVSYYAFIKKHEHRGARGVWPDLARSLSYEFKPTFLVSQLFIK